MITLIRLMILKYKKVKWELAVWQLLDKELMNIVKNPEIIEKKLLPFIAETVHKASEFEKFKQQTGEYGEK